MMRDYYAAAIDALVPNNQTFIENSKVTWIVKPENIPTDEEIIRKITELQYIDEVTNDYKEKRSLEYPPMEDQLDKIYHSGVNAWKADIKSIKDKYPKTSINSDELKKRQDTAVEDNKKTNYLAAVERLKKPRIKLGTPYTETVWDVSQNKYVDQINYRDIPHPYDDIVVTDESERDAAQATIDATPQSIIDSINT